MRAVLVLMLMLALVLVLLGLVRISKHVPLDLLFALRKRGACWLTCTRTGQPQQYCT